MIEELFGFAKFTKLFRIVLSVYGDLAVYCLMWKVLSSFCRVEFLASEVMASYGGLGADMVNLVDADSVVRKNCNK